MSASTETATFEATDDLPPLVRQRIARFLRERQTGQVILDISSGVVRGCRVLEFLRVPAPAGEPDRPRRNRPVASR